MSKNYVLIIGGFVLLAILGFVTLSKVSPDNLFLLVVSIMGFGFIAWMVYSMKQEYKGLLK